MDRRVRKGLRRDRAPAGAKNRKKNSLQIIFKYPRSSIKPGSAPDPRIVPRMTIGIRGRIIIRNMYMF